MHLRNCNKSYLTPVFAWSRDIKRYMPKPYVHCSSRLLAAASADCLLNQCQRLALATGRAQWASLCVEGLVRPCLELDGVNDCVVRTGPPTSTAGSWD